MINSFASRFFLGNCLPPKVPLELEPYHNKLFSKLFSKGVDKYVLNPYTYGIDKRRKQMPYTLSIETTEGRAKQHGFHLGTNLPTARSVVQDKMRAFVAHRQPVVTMALKLNGKIVDVLYPDGSWHNAGS